MCHISIQLVHQSFNVMQSSGHTLLGMSKLDCNKPTVLIYIIKPSKYTPLKNTLSHRQKRVDIYKIDRPISRRSREEEAGPKTMNVAMTTGQSGGKQRHREEYGGGMNPTPPLPAALMARYT